MQKNERFQDFGALFKTNHLIYSVSVEKLYEDKQGNIWMMTINVDLFGIDAQKPGRSSLLTGK